MDEPHLLAPGLPLSNIVANIIRRRRSTRHFTKESVAEEQLLDLVEVGINAPSGSNTQNQRFLILTDREALSRFDKVRFVWPYRSYKKRKEGSDRSGIIAHSAAVIVVFADSSLTGTRSGREYYIWESLNTQNCSASIQNILIMATAMGLGTCWVSATEAMRHSRLLSGQSWRAALQDYAIPPDYHIQGLILVGHPRKTDPEGFPAGEGMHGTDWTPTARAPVAQYLIQRRDGQPKAAPPVAVGLGIRAATSAIRSLLFVVELMERVVHRMEVPYLTSQREDRRK